MTDWVLIKCDSVEPGSLPACVEVCLGKPSTLKAPRHCTFHFLLCHREERGNWSEPSQERPAEFQLWHSRGNTGSFLKLSCYSKALHLLEQSGGSSRFLLYEPVVLTEAPSSLWLCHRNILFLCFDPCTHCIQKGEVVGRRREDRTKQINNVMSPSRRNFTLAAPLLL